MNAWSTWCFGAASVLMAACSADGASLPAKGTGGMTSTGGAQYEYTGGATAADGAANGGALFSAPTSMTTGCGTVEVLFVIDRSGSMNCNLPPLTSSSQCEANPQRVDATQPSKWDVVRDAFSVAFDSLIPSDDSVDVRAGSSFFSVDDICGASSAPAIPIASATPDHIESLRQSLDITPAGGTPIVGATILAYKHLYQPETFTGNAHVILLTDGADSCADSYEAALGPGDYIADLINIEAPKALSVGIKTWVIGAPGSEPARHMLSSLAVAGGTAQEGCDPGDGSDPTVGNCHYDMTTGDFQQTLSETLRSIVELVTCKIR